METNFWQVLATTGPGAVAVICTVFVMLYFEEKREIRREANAKAKAIEDREHELKIQAMWRDSFMLMNAKTDETFKLISEMLKEMTKNISEQYEKIGITQDLLKITKEHNKVR